MRLVVVSNRLPFTTAFERRTPKFTMSAGGLSTGLWSYMQQAEQPFLWVGWPGAHVAQNQRDAVREHARGYNASPVFLAPESIERFYHGFCNKTLWPLFHYFQNLVHYDDEGWAEYRRVNEAFADHLTGVLEPGDHVWVHDYQLMLLPEMLRQRFPTLPIGFFLHIPFPSYELFRLLPETWRAELINGVLGASLVGFHTHDYTRDFLTSVLRTVGHEHKLGRLAIGDRAVRVDSFPMGIDYARIAESAASEETEQRVAKLREQCHGQKLIFSVDRLDYTKGLINRLRGYERFLRQNPEWHGKVTFLVSVAPSRTGVESYRQMKREIEQTVGSIIGEFGTVDWTPLVYQYRNLPFDEIIPLYRACDVALITPLRDGMNLVAKEFVASRIDRTGVLVLSEMAGAAKEMPEALTVNPYHGDEFADAIARALEMPIDEQVRRNALMQDRLRRYDVNRWAADFTGAMADSEKGDAERRATRLTGETRAQLVQSFDSAHRRALLLDYDGTLVPFSDKPANAAPDDELLELLEAIGRRPSNDAVIISGRPRADLERWFGDLPVSLIAEHGAWMRSVDGEWRLRRPIETEWKDRIRTILERYVDRLPGALLEQKEFSLAWHYRRADPEQAAMRTRELLDDLTGFTRNIDVQVIEGNKVIEVRAAGVNKGSAAVDWLEGKSHEFVLCVGDDWTDEDMFRVMPSSAYTVRVGLAETAARFHLSGPPAVRRLLQQLDRSGGVSGPSDAPDDWFVGAARRPARFGSTAPARVPSASPSEPRSPQRGF
ncbi:MAG: bifunctional alpha,alpha-trehalose-phosphate synthase (UDP-forming)/trehalose-phosphatase [Gammaproteobacteria bacterium]